MHTDITEADVKELLRRIAARLDQVTEQLAGRTKPHFTVEEVASLTGRSPYTVRRWIAEGRLNATRVQGTGPRGRLLVPKEELAKLI